MEDIVFLYDFLDKNELDYLTNLINDNTKWSKKFDYKEPKAFFDAIDVDFDKIKKYHKTICENDKYIIRETQINVISSERQLKNSIHIDNADLTYVTYLNDDFIGGDFCYYNSKNEEFRFSPKKGMTIKLNPKLRHKVDDVNDGVRFSLYTFLFYKQKDKKSLL